MDGEDKYFPETFLIPEDYDAYIKTHKKHKNRVYISKTNCGSLGTGVKMIFSPKDFAVKGMNIYEEDKVVQKYLRKPLLINNLKHDLRIYVLIASVDPFIAFINEEGLARFCTEPYEVPSQSNKSKDKHVHLTNYAQNKTNANYKCTNELIEMNDVTKQTLSS